MAPTNKIFSVVSLFILLPPDKKENDIKKHLLIAEYTLKF